MIGLREDQRERAQLVARIVALFPAPPMRRVKPAAVSQASKGAG